MGQGFTPFCRCDGRCPVTHTKPYLILTKYYKYYNTFISIPVPTSYISTLFSSLGNRSNGSTIFSGLDYSTLSSIHNGSYKKLLNAYYNKTGNKDAVSSITAGKTDVKKTDTNAVSTRNNASNVSEDIDTLNKSDLWKQKEIKAEDGSKTKEYDKDAIYKAVSSYVKDYNLLVDSAGNSESSSVLRTASSMVNYTKANKSVLASMGISIGADNKLSIDEKTFKGSSMAAVKSAFLVLTISSN